MLTEAASIMLRFQAGGVLSIASMDGFLVRAEEYEQHQVLGNFSCS